MHRVSLAGLPSRPVMLVSIVETVHKARNGLPARSCYSATPDITSILGVLSPSSLAVCDLGRTDGRLAIFGIARRGVLDLNVRNTQP